jgi:hypothetical protein
VIDGVTVTSLSAFDARKVQRRIAYAKSRLTEKIA